MGHHLVGLAEVAEYLGLVSRGKRSGPVSAAHRTVSEALIPGQGAHVGRQAGSAFVHIPRYSRSCPWPALCVPSGPVS